MYLINGQLNPLVNKYSTMPDSHILLFNARGKVKTSAKVTFPYLTTDLLAEGSEFKPLHRRDTPLDDDSDGWAVSQSPHQARPTGRTPVDADELPELADASSSDNDSKPMGPFVT